VPAHVGKPAVAAVTSRAEPCSLFTLAIVTFARDQWSIDVRNATGVEAITEQLQQCVGARVLVEGFSDPQGSETANRTLARRRAERVAAFLSTRGVDPGRIVVAETSIDDQRPRSRRVDVSLIPAPAGASKR
jgi:outer membrane protein OmpA-like peptidoglycan-associated protein